MNVPSLSLLATRHPRPERLVLAGHFTRQLLSPFEREHLSSCDGCRRIFDAGKVFSDAVRKGKLQPASQGAACLLAETQRVAYMGLCRGAPMESSASALSHLASCPECSCAASDILIASLREIEDRTVIHSRGDEKMPQFPLAFESCPSSISLVLHLNYEKNLAALLTLSGFEQDVPGDGPVTFNLRFDGIARKGVRENHTHTLPSLVPSLELRVLSKERYLSTVFLQGECHRIRDGQVTLVFSFPEGEAYTVPAVWLLELVLASLPTL